MIRAGNALVDEDHDMAWYNGSRMLFCGGDDDVKDNGMHACRHAVVQKMNVIWITMIIKKNRQKNCKSGVTMNEWIFFPL